MSRNSNGVYSVPVTLQPGTTARASDVNQIATDAGEALTDSLSRSGFGGMLAQFKSVDGSASQPGMSFTSDPDTGFRRSGDGTLTFVSNGVDILSFGPGGLLVGGQPIRMIGEIIPWPGVAQPNGWFFCSGAEVSRTEFAGLFGVIGTRFGAGNGSTTFNLPDLRGRVPAGNDSPLGHSSGRLSSVYGAAATTIGGSFGSATHTLTEPQMPYHQHGGATTGAGAHSHTVTIPVSGSVSAGGAPIIGPQMSSQTYATSGVGDHAHNVVTDFRGGNQPHPIVQPTLIINYIIKVV